MTAAEQSDPLAPVCAVLAAELLGQQATESTHAASPLERVVTAQPVREVADDLEDDEFCARIARPQRARTSPQSETATTAEVLKDLNARPEHHFQKMHQGSHSGSGEPDLDGCVRGRCVKIEMKANPYRPSAKQNRRLLTWQKAGALVGWARSLDEVDAILSHLDDPTYRYTGQPGG